MEKSLINNRWQTGQMKKALSVDEYIRQKISSLRGCRMCARIIKSGNRVMVDMYPAANTDSPANNDRDDKAKITATRRLSI